MISHYCNLCLPKQLFWDISTVNSKINMEMRLDYREWLVVNRALRISVVYNFIFNGFLKTRSAEHIFMGHLLRLKVVLTSLIPLTIYLHSCLSKNDEETKGKRMGDSRARVDLKYCLVQTFCLQRCTSPHKCFHSPPPFFFQSSSWLLTQLNHLVTSVSQNIKQLELWHWEGALHNI